MIRGTTPTHTFELPFDSDMVSKARVLYAQNGIIVLTKDNEECLREGSCISVKLTQKDTLKFDCNYPVEVQIRVLLDNEEALASTVIKVSVGKCLENEVL